MQNLLFDNENINNAATNTGNNDANSNSSSFISSPKSSVKNNTSLKKSDVCNVSDWYLQKFNNINKGNGNR